MHSVQILVLAFIKQNLFFQSSVFNFSNSITKPNLQSHKWKVEQYFSVKHFILLMNYHSEIHQHCLLHMLLIIFQLQIIWHKDCLHVYSDCFWTTQNIFIYWIIDTDISIQLSFIHIVPIHKNHHLNELSL